jgi:trigger factor
VRNYLVENYESQYTQRLEEAIRNSLYEKSTFKKDIPEAMIERMNESIASELTAYAQQYGVDLKTLMQLAYGSTEDSYEQDIKDMASESIKKNIILKAIGDKEGLSMSDDDFQAELEAAISNSGYTSADDVPREDQESYREILDRRKVMDFLKSKTTVNAPAAEEGSTGATAAAAETETVK